MNGVAQSQPHADPRLRRIIALDIEGSTTRKNPAKAVMRADMYRMLEEALLECGVTEDPEEPFFDRGDGVITLVHPADSVPTTMLLHTFIPALRKMLVEHAAIRPDRMFRVRVAIHDGVVHFDRRGAFGEDMDITCRLLDSQKLKDRLHRQPDALLILAVSDHIYHTIIRHDYAGIDSSTFEPVIEIQVGTQPYIGWVQIPE
jgi:hypothetical protein